MAITFHPQAESLMSCSAGSMPEAFAAVMASHISVCPACQKDLALMQEIGVAMMEQIQPVSVTKPAPVLALRASEADVESEPPGTAMLGDVPSPLVAVIGHRLDGISWLHAAPGVWQHVIPLSPGARGSLRLIKVSPGVKLPEHGHRGSELTLVLKGSFQDARGHYKIGDVADLYDDVEHAPVADAREGCICLVANEGRMRFKSRLARLMQPFTRM